MIARKIASHPLILEINTWPWLTELSIKNSDAITLANIPEGEFDSWEGKFDYVWLMGLWERSPNSREIARNHEGLEKEYKSALPDYTRSDVVGSPYAIRRYKVDPRFGGETGLKKARDALMGQGIGLILDFVPNHVAVNHPWTETHPEYFLKGNKEEYTPGSDWIYKVGDNYYLHGKDPNFPPWMDTIQLNAFSDDYRIQTIETLTWISRLADGVRCDMAMLMDTAVFQGTWGWRGVEPLKEQYWREVISSTKERAHDFKFIAEVYWNMEYELQQQGFDFCYDKTLYDRLLHGTPDSIRKHLWADCNYQTKLVRFTENHDEQRAFSAFGDKKSRAASVIALTLPGARLVYRGQMEGRRVKLPVQLGRFPKEQLSSEISIFYTKFITTIGKWIKGNGKWSLMDTVTLGFNKEKNPVITHAWEYENHDVLTLVNYSDQQVKGTINLNDLDHLELAEKSGKIMEQLHLREKNDFNESFVDNVYKFALNPWEYQVWAISI